jgi:NitT/TauT family transport system ATP-binding protein
MKGKAIVIRSLRKQFRQMTTGALVTAIDGLDFRIEAGEIVAIVGQTGCGKSTFFDILIGLERPSAGELLIDGRQPYSEFDSFRGEIATIFQQDRLLPWRTAIENVCLPLEMLKIPKEEQRARAALWLHKLGLDKFVNAYPHELSGGMRQRVAIARAFALQAGLLLADESFGHLDEVTAASLRKTFVELTRETKSTAVLITHQLEEAIQVGDRIVVFGKPSRILADIRVSDWASQPLSALREAIQATLEQNEASGAIASSQPAEAIASSTNV